MAIPNGDVIANYEQKYSDLYEMLLQQEDARFDVTFSRRGDHRGSMAAQAIKQIGAITAIPRTTRYAPIQFSDVPIQARWVYPNACQLAIPYDTWDEIQSSADPKSWYVKETLMAMNRQKDDYAITALLGSAQVTLTGQNGATQTSTVNFPSTGSGAYGVNNITTSGVNQQVVTSAYGASAATGLTKVKLEQAIRMMIAWEVDLNMDTIWCAVTNAQWKNLMDETTFINRDYNTGTNVIKSAKLESFLGCNFIHSERLPVGMNGAGSTERCNPVWAGSGMHWGIWQDVATRISIRDDLEGPTWQVYTYMYVGSTRMQEGKVVQINCAES